MTPTIVINIPTIPKPLIVSPSSKYAAARDAAGDKVVSTLPVLGLRIAYILNAKKSPIVSPTIPEKPSQNQLYAYMEENIFRKKFMFNRRFAMPRKNTANSNLR
jgi:hypothetical protein